MHTLRIHCTGRPGAQLKSVVGTCPAAAWDADDLTINVWLDGGTQTAGVPDAFDITSIATLRLEGRATVDTEEMYFDAQEVTTFTACTFTEFKDLDGQHASFVLTGTEMNLGPSVASIWISITAELSDGTRHTFAAGELKIEHSGDSTAQDPVSDPVTPYARYGFRNVAVSGQATVTADTREDTLTLVAGSGIELTTSANSVTITNTGGGGGGGSGTVTSVSVTTANGVSGSVANATTTPAITITLGAITPTTVRGLTITTTTGTLTLTNAKTFSVSNTLTLTGTDGSTLNVGAGGTLGQAAFIGKSSGGNGAGDSGKALTFDSNGGINVTGEIVVTGGTGASSISGAALTDARLHTLPDADGTLATQEWVNGETTTTGASGKIAKLDGGGGLTLGGSLTLPDSVSSGTAGAINGGLILYPSAASEGITTIRATAATGDNQWDFPDEDGTFASREWVGAWTGSANITTLGTISTGTWSASTIAADKGGTGRTGHTAYAVLCGGTTSTGAQQSIASVGTAGQVLTSNGAGALPTFQAAASGGTVDVQVFTVANGATTWTKPANAKTVRVVCIGAGGGGGSGRKGAAATARSGGGGGSHGGYAMTVLNASDCGATETVTPGTGGTGGTAISANSTSGNAGNNGGHSSFGSLLRAPGGIGGTAGGTASLATGANAAVSQWQSAAGGGTSVSNASPAVTDGFGGSGGGGGSIRTSDSLSSVAVKGGAGYGPAGAIAGGAAGTSSSSPTAGSAGTSAGTDTPYIGGGGGGGGSTITAAQNSQAGGAGGIYGGGGGGGGASLDSVSNSGAGGAGGNGIVIVITTT